MARGRHAAPRGAKGGSRKTHRASAGGAALTASADGRAVGRHAGGRHSAVAFVESPSAPTVISRTGAIQGLSALAPIAVLSAAAVVGVSGVIGDGTPGDSGRAQLGAVAPQVLEPTLITPVSGPQTRATLEPRPSRALTSGSAGREQVTQDPSSGPAEFSSPSTPRTAAQQDDSVSAAPDSAGQESSPRAPAPDSGTESDDPTGPSDDDTSIPLPEPTATAAPEPEDSLSELEATTICLESGISALDVEGLAACVDDLLS